MALTGIRAAVTRAGVSGPLNERQPEILDSDVPAQIIRFEELVRGAAVEVVLLTGSDPYPGPIRDLAVQAIILETASAIEYAEWPEQQASGDIGRGYHLHQRYLELLAKLTKIMAAIGGVIPPDGGESGIPSGGALPSGQFPAPSCYPDPVQQPGHDYAAAWRIP